MTTTIARAWAASRLLCVAALIGLAVACGGSSDKGASNGSSSSGQQNAATTATAKVGGTLRWATGFERASLNAALQTPSAYPSIVSLTIFDGLTRIDPEKEYKPAPALATSWEASADGLTYTFKLRSGVKWHDGQPFNADDVKFTYDMVRNPASGAITASDFTLLDRVEVVDPLTVRMVLKQPFAPLLGKVALAIVPKHLLDGKDVKTADFNIRPVGTGPFKFKEWRKGEFLEMEANQEYWGGRPNLDRFILKFAPDASTRFLQVQTGESEGAIIESKQVAQAKGSDKLNVISTKSASPMVFVFNVRNPLFTDPRVRIAINHAIDKEALVKSAGSGVGTAAYGPLQNTPFDSQPADAFAYDPKKSEQIFTDAGWRKGSSGVWEKDGRPLSFTLYAQDYGGTIFGLNEANVMATSMKQNGIDVKVETRTASQLFGAPEKIDAIMYNFGSPVDADELYFLFHSSATIERGGYNFGGYNNKQVDAALDAGRTTTDDAKRKAAYREFQNALNADPANGWGYYPDGVVVALKKVRGPKVIPGATSNTGEAFLFSNVKDWSLE